jgi:hypothetical protein
MAFGRQLNSAKIAASLPPQSNKLHKQATALTANNSYIASPKSTNNQETLGIFENSLAASCLQAKAASSANLR